MPLAYLQYYRVTVLWSRTTATTTNGNFLKAGVYTGKSYCKRLCTMQYNTYTFVNIITEYHFLQQCISLLDEPTRSYKITSACFVVCPHCTVCVCVCLLCLLQAERRKPAAIYHCCRCRLVAPPLPLAAASSSCLEQEEAGSPSPPSRSDFRCRRDPVGALHDVGEISQRSQTHTHTHTIHVYIHKHRTHHIIHTQKGEARTSIRWLLDSIRFNALAVAASSLIGKMMSLHIILSAEEP